MAVLPGDLDASVRLAAFAFLDEQTRLHGETLPREVLAAGFVFDDIRVRLLGPQGIFKPALIDLPLSITTVPPVEGRRRPYEDEFGANGLLRYRPQNLPPLSDALESGGIIRCEPSRIRLRALPMNVARAGVE